MSENRSVRRLPGAATILLCAVGAFAQTDFAVRSGSLRVRLSPAGRIVAVESADISRAVDAETALEGARKETRVTARRVSGGVEFESTHVHPSGHRATVVERFLSQPRSVRWEVEVRGDGRPWTTPILTRLRYPVSNETRFWTAWSDPNPGNESRARRPLETWSDPLRGMPLAERRFWFGGPYFTYDDPHIAFCPYYGDLLTIPLAAFLEPARDTGLSLVLSPEGDLLDMVLTTHPDGALEFSRHFHRISAARGVRFAMDLVAHEADWRGPLRWMAERYPAYFGPALEAAHELSGTGAYSASERPFDPEKMRRMAFSANWKASFDFPYMGMFLPPVEGESWPRYGGDSDGRITSGQPAKRGLTTIAGMSAYSTNMRKLGFHVLNYFNVTEFGADVIFPAPPRHANSDSELWKNANDFLYGKLRDAILYVPDRVNPEAMKRHKGTVANGPYFTWGNGIIMDAGEPVYRDFLIEQGRRHIEKLPDSSGICIDRLDWLRMYNERRDDGVTWFVDRPARSLLSSWRGIMNQLLPLMHSAGKVVFVNNHDKRLDTLKDIDGIFDEFTTNPAALNTTALLCVTRPALGWTNHEKQIRPDPDGLFQRFLYMGVFPMAPYPGNDHSLGPSEWVDRQYLDYGPLMNAMRGRKWVLEPHAAEVPDGTAKANLFAVKDGFVAPVMFGGSRARARVHLRIPGGVRGMEAIHPGSGRAVKVSYRREGSAYIVDVPLVRGCAMVRIQ